MAPSQRSRSGFTLVEILVATVLTLLLMGLVVTIFADVGSSVSGSRSLVTTTDQLRNTYRRLQIDLNGATARTVPPLRPEDNRGYLEIVEGPIGPIVVPSSVAFDDADRDGVGVRDTTFGDPDDILMLTVRSRPNEPFVGRFSFKDFVIDDPTTPGTDEDGTDTIGPFQWRSTTITSEVAEVCWFVRGRTLFRRVLLVLTDQQLPDSDVRDAAFTPLPTEPGFYRNYDISAHQVGGALDRSPVLVPIRVVPNTLGDLTRREWRYGHQPYVYPHEVRFWGGLGLPTLRECSYIGPGDPPTDYWPFPLLDPSSLPDGTALVQSDNYADTGSQLICPSHASASGASATPLPLANVYGDWQASPTFLAGQVFDPWTNPHPTEQIDPVTGTLVETRIPPAPPDDRRYLGDRIAEDVILNNVLAFDVKVYDSGAPIVRYIDPATAFETVYMPGDPGYLTALSAATPGGNPEVIGFGAYVDLGYMATIPSHPLNVLLPNYDAPAGAPPAQFHHSGNPFSNLGGSPQASGTPVAATWDSSSEHYEHNGLNEDGDGMTDEHADGFDNYASGLSNDNVGSGGAGTFRVGGIDDPTEREAPPPYDAPLRGIQIRVRVFEPNSRQIREVTVVQDFLPG